MDDVQLILLDEVDSTLSEAERLVEAGHSKRTVICAKSQTGGHGRFGRLWTSPPGNLYWTLILPCERHWPVDSGLPFVSGLAVMDCLRATGVSSDLISLKWPNDALVEGKKISGILIKSVYASARGTSGAYALIGIGINIATYPKDTFFPATSLNALGLDDVDIATMRDELTAAYLRRLEQWQSGGFSAIRAECVAKLHGVGLRQQVAVNRERTDVIEGINRGIDENGSLMLEMPSGTIRLISAGDMLGPL